MKENIPEGKRRTNKGLEILTNSVCMEMAGYRKAEEDRKWGSLGVKV